MGRRYVKFILWSTFRGSPLCMGRRFVGSTLCTGRRNERVAVLSGRRFIGSTFRGSPLCLVDVSWVDVSWVDVLYVNRILHQLVIMLYKHLKTGFNL